jgi:hypothetical protein
MSTDVSDEHVASIFRVEEAKQETSMKAGGKQLCLQHVPSKHQLISNGLRRVMSQKIEL